MSPTDSTDIDPLAELDDDLGDDWESAFQSEDFMFSPDEEDNDFFLFDENDSEEDVDELTSIMESAEQEVLQEQQETEQEIESSQDEDLETDTPPQTLPEKLLSIASMGLSFYTSRPLYQRAIAAAIPCLAILLFMATFFLRSTTEEFAQTDKQEVVIADKKIDSAPKPQPAVETIPEIVTPPPEQQPPRARTIRKQWNFPTFTIVSSSPNNGTLFVNVNLSLIAILPEGASLPEEKNVLVKDLIYQFYKNRSPRELKRFALARGEMIHKLHSWLKKEWPDSPVNTVIFSKDQVISAQSAS